MAASLCVYHGGMALNDWKDRGEDAAKGRARPIPRGDVRPGQALALAAVLLFSGPLVALAISPRCFAVVSAVALLATLYDLAGRGPWRGPLLLASCRAGNLGAGLALASSSAVWRPALLAASLSYGAYVFSVSRLARLEDADSAAEELRPAPLVVAMTVALIGTGAVGVALALSAPGSVPATRHGSLGWLALGPGLLGSLGLLRAVTAHGRRPWRSSEVERIAGMGLRRFLLASAALALGAGTTDGLVVALLVLCGYPASFALRKLFPPT
jgi:4-hydroxybenzoate polyprenyltransferase